MKSFMKMKAENKVIANAIMAYQNGLWSEKKKLLDEVDEKGYFSAGDFQIEPQPWCYVVWKPTDMKVNPEFKGEPLSKIIPDTYLTIEQIHIILRSQPWVYN